MNRNVESHFSELPSVDIERSVFDRSFTHKTSFNVGDLIPFCVEEVLPGDTFRMTTSKVVRLQTMLTPIMDNIYLDTYYFFVPNRLVWEHWREFMGENTGSAWIPSTTYTVPLISAPATTGFSVGGIADFMGIPVGIPFTTSDEQCPIALPFRGYALICNEFFRDENLTAPLNIPTGDSNQTGTNGSSYINDVANGGKPFKVAKYHDRFTSCLPGVQKGPAVKFPLISGSLAPVKTGLEQTDFTGWSNMKWYTSQSIGSGVHQLEANFASAGPGYGTGLVRGTSSTDTGYNYVPANLWADLSTSVGAVTINELRLAFQLQKFYERCARGGTRYIEMLKAHFGVTSPDARLQRPEYLGGNRVPLNIHEVTNNAQSSTDFLGDLGAKSATSDVHEDFEKSFTEHGFVIGVMCVRYDHTYPQGLEKKWKRKNVLDYYFPVFANIGEQPVFTDEICATTTNMATADVFGYQEAWSSYRYAQNYCTSEMRPGVANSLASWHLADNYASAPTLSDAWIREDLTNVDRVLAVTSAYANQVFCDIYVQNIVTRPMPMYSIPGLVDHH